MRQFVRQSIGSALAVSALGTLLIWGRRIGSLFPCVKPGCFSSNAGCPFDDHCTIESDLRRWRRR